MLNRNYLQKVVVVDDSPAARSTLAGILRTGGYQVVGEAKNSEEALNHCKWSQPEIIYLDIHLNEEKNGLDLLKMIKGQWPKLPVIMVTGDATINILQEAIEFGAHAFLKKPLNGKMVLKTAEQVLSDPRNLKEKGIKVDK